MTHKKEKNEIEINKKNTINSINQDFQNEQSKKNIWGGSISPKITRKMKIDDNDNEKNIINLFQITDKLYTNDEHFHKSLIPKNKNKNKNQSSNIIRRNQFNSGRLNNIHQKKKLVITFGLNEGNNNNHVADNRKNFFVQNSDKNFLFKRRMNTIVKDVDSDLHQSKEQSNFSYYLKLKQRFRFPSKDINEESNGNYTSKHKNENHKNYALNNCHTNNEKNLTKRNSQFCRAKTNKSFKNINSPKKIKEEEIEKEETYIKQKKVNVVKDNIKKVNSRKESSNKDNNKTQIVNDVVELPKKEQNKQKKSKFCFLCCLNNNLNDSDDL